MAPKVKSARKDEVFEMEKIVKSGQIKPKKSKKRPRNSDATDKAQVGLFKEKKSKSEQSIFTGINDEYLSEMGLSLLEDVSNDAKMDVKPISNHSIKFQSTGFIFSNTVSDPVESAVIQEEHCDYFSLIVDEVMLQIFKRLSKPTLICCARVCKRWNRLAFDETLWRRIDLGGRIIKPGIIGQLLNQGTQIIRLAKSTVQSPILLNIRSNSCQLQYVDLSMSVITVKCLNELVETCRQLKKLSLEHCEINDEISSNIGQNSHLVSLNLSMVAGLTKTGLINILKGCSSLKDLNIAWTNLDHSTLFVMASLMPESIERLNMSGFRNILTNDVVVNLVERCVRLEELDLSDSGLLTGVAIETILKLPKLQHLSLSRCYNISPIHFLSLRNLSSLSSLVIFGIFVDSALQTLQSSLPNIEINKNRFSTIARPTTGVRCTSLWGLRVRD